MLSLYITDGKLTTSIISVRESLGPNSNSPTENKTLIVHIYFIYLFLSKEKNMEKFDPNFKMFSKYSDVFKMEGNRNVENRRFFFPSPCPMRNYCASCRQFCVRERKRHDIWYLRCGSCHKYALMWHFFEIRPDASPRWKNCENFSRFQYVCASVRQSINGSTSFYAR